MLFAALKAIEDTFPVEAFTSDVSQNHNTVNQAEVDRDRFLNFLEASIPSLLSEVNGNVYELEKLLKSTEPFSSNWVITQEFIKQQGMHK